MAITDERRIRVMTSALKTILAEAKEPIIKVYAQSALDETTELPSRNAEYNEYCKQHNWYVREGEKCPICCKNKMRNP